MRDEWPKRRDKPSIQKNGKEYNGIHILLRSRHGFNLLLLVDREISLKIQKNIGSNEMMFWFISFKTLPI
jgi:hypothetical protein